MSESKLQFLGWNELSKWFVASKNYQRKPLGEIDLNIDENKARQMLKKGYVFFRSRRKTISQIKSYIKSSSTTPIYFG